MKKIDEKRIKSELLRVQSAKAGMEYRIEELLEEIDRLKENILIQEKTEIGLLEKLKAE